MPRKPGADGALEPINFRLPKPLLEALDLEVEEHKKKHPGAMFTRSDLIRTVLYEHLEKAKQRKR